MIIKYLSNRESFIKLIESIGFEYKSMGIYYYKEFRIDLYRLYYDFYNEREFEWIYDISLNDWTPINKYLKKELRSYKLKALLR